METFLNVSCLPLAIRRCDVANDYLIQNANDRVTEDMKHLEKSIEKGPLYVPRAKSG